MRQSVLRLSRYIPSRPAFHRTHLRVVTSLAHRTHPSAAPPPLHHHPTPPLPLTSLLRHLCLHRFTSVFTLKQPFRNFSEFTTSEGDEEEEQQEEEDEMTENKYLADYARLGTSGCKKCKQKLAKGSFRIAKVVPNPFSEEGGDMKQYHHPSCIFETFIRARPSTKIIEDEADLMGYDELTDEDKELVQKLIKETMEKKGNKKTPTKKGKSPAAASPAKASAKAAAASPAKPAPAPIKLEVTEPKNPELAEKDNSFRQFRRLCAEIAEESSYTGKTGIISKFISKGSSGDGYHGDKYMLLKLLLPGFVKTVYNLKDKQLVKIFSRIFGTSEADMIEDLEKGDVPETIRCFFEINTILPPSKKSNVSLQEVDRYLTELAKYTKEDDQQTVLTAISKRCTSNDLKMVIRLIKHDLRINAGAKHVLDALDPNAYQAFQASRNLRDVVDRVAELKDTKPGMGSKKLSVRASLMTPILPMLDPKEDVTPREEDGEQGDDESSGDEGEFSPPVHSEAKEEEEEEDIFSFGEYWGSEGGNTAFFDSDTDSEVLRDLEKMPPLEEELFGIEEYSDESSNEEEDDEQEEEDSYEGEREELDHYSSPNSLSSPPPKRRNTGEDVFTSDWSINRRWGVLLADKLQLLPPADQERVRVAFDTALMNISTGMMTSVDVLSRLTTAPLPTLYLKQEPTSD